MITYSDITVAMTICDSSLRWMGSNLTKQLTGTEMNKDFDKQFKVMIGPRRKDCVGISKCTCYFGSWMCSSAKCQRLGEVEYRLVGVLINTYTVSQSVTSLVSYLWNSCANQSEAWQHKLNKWKDAFPGNHIVVWKVQNVIMWTHSTRNLQPETYLVGFLTVNYRTDDRNK